MKAIITGHKGYIGAKLFKKCQQLGYEVIGVDLKENKRDINYISHYNDCAAFQADVLFHLAAIPAVQYSVENPAETCYHNVLGTSNVLQFAKNNGIKKVIFSSSSAVYGNNGTLLSPYAVHKKQSEMECELYKNLFGLDIVCLRYFNVFSEDQVPTTSYPTVIAAWMKAIREKKDLLIYGDGTQTRDFIHVNDIVDCNLFFANYNNSLAQQCFDVGAGQSYSLNHIKEFVLSKHNVNFINLESRKSDIADSIAEINSLKQLGWHAKIHFNEGLRMCFAQENLK